MPGILAADLGRRRSSERDVPGRIRRPRADPRPVRLVPDLPGGAPAEMPGRRSSERGKARTAACRRRRQSVLVQPVAVVQDEQDSYSVRLERIEEAIPGPEVITAGLRL